LLEASEADAPALAEAADQTARRLDEAAAGLAVAEEARRAADAARHRWTARAEALSQALDEARARSGARRLAEVEGMLGALVELVDVDMGMEAAFEAAAGEALSAVLMDGEQAARQGLELLAGKNVPGAVIALGGSSAGGASAGGSSAGGASAGGASAGGASAGGASAGPGVAPGGVPDDARRLREHVRSRQPAVSALLDRLLAGAVVVEGGWSAAVDLSTVRPDLVVVTRAGDRCAGGIWRTGSHGTGATGAALDEARGALAEAEVASAQASRLESQAKEALEQARAASADARRAVAESSTAARAASLAIERANADMAEVIAEAQAIAAQRDEHLARRDRDSSRADELEALLPALDAAAEEQGRKAAAERAARSRLVERSAAVATLRRDLEVRATGIEERRGLLSKRLSEVELRLAGHLVGREQAAERRARLGSMAVAVERLGCFVEERLAWTEDALEKLRRLRRAEADALRVATEGLEALRRERAGAERRLSAVREQMSRAELEEAQLRARLESLTETVRRELDCEPGALAGAECPELGPGTSAPNRARELERELRLMGPVNPLALEEHAELEERHKFLEGQLHDVSAARRELAKVIKAVDAEIITVFQAAYQDVAENFAKLVTTLFPGGQGALSLSDPSNILESGVELEVRPVGKNLKRLSLLSGGERSLVALAFLFAVFRSRPSPFYMMDEVESALDDVNLHRFLDLVNEFRSEAQLLIVSHQKRTMEAADCLYGVSMPPGGSSMVVSEKVERQERAGSAAP